MRPSHCLADMVTTVFLSMQSLKSRAQASIAGCWMESGNIHTKQLTNVRENFLIEGRDEGLFKITEPTNELAKTIVHTLEALFIPLRGQTSTDKIEIAGVLTGILFRAYFPSHGYAEQAVNLVYENLKD